MKIQTYQIYLFFINSINYNIKSNQNIAIKIQVNYNYVRIN